jgi:hypothetical protein
MSSPGHTDRPAASDPAVVAAVALALAAAPVPPRDPSLFTSGTLFGEPGTYPAGSPMAPAAHTPSEDMIADEVAAVAAATDRCPPAGTTAAAPGRGERIRSAWSDERLSAAASPAVVRAAVALLAGTVAAPVVAAFVDGRLPVGRIGVGPTASSGRVVGPPAQDVDGGTSRVVNERYAGEHPASVAPSVAHDLLWSGPGAGHAEEATLHLVVAAVHLQLVAACPRLAHLGTELTRRQNALALTLLNSRRPGSARIEAIAPDGPGTIPGGDPHMQTRDFWSIPFAAPAPTPAGPPGPLVEVVAAVLAPLVDAAAGVPRPLRYDADLAALLGSTDAWLPPAARLRAAVALGALDGESALDAVATGAGRSPGELRDALGLDEATACWRDPA